MESFNRELFWMDLDKIESNPDKMKFVVELTNSVREHKMKFIQEMKFKDAAEWRDDERYLNSVLENLIKNEESNIDNDIENAPEK